MPGGTINWRKPLEVLISDACNVWADATIISDNIDSVELEYFNYSISYRCGDKKKPYRVTVNHQGMIKGRPDFGVIVRNKKPETNATTDPRNEDEETSQKSTCYNKPDSDLIMSTVNQILERGYGSISGNTKEEVSQKRATWEKFVSTIADVYVIYGIIDPPKTTPIRQHQTVYRHIIGTKWVCKL